MWNVILRNRTKVELNRRPVNFIRFFLMGGNGNVKTSAGGVSVNVERSRNEAVDHSDDADQ